MLLALFALVAPAHAADLILGAGQTGSFACEKSQAVKITGSALTITLTGDCGRLDVVGSTNTVTVDGVAAIHVEGSMNTVKWSRNLSGADVLPITKVGVNNKVRKN